MCVWYVVLVHVCGVHICVCMCGVCGCVYVYMHVWCLCMCVCVSVCTIDNCSVCGISAVVHSEMKIPKTYIHTTD